MAVEKMGGRGLCGVAGLGVLEVAGVCVPETQSPQAQGAGEDSGISAWLAGSEEGVSCPLTGRRARSSDPSSHPHGSVPHWTPWRPTGGGSERPHRPPASPQALIFSVPVGSNPTG